MRTALRGKRRFIATPRVAKHRIFVWLDAHVLPTNKVCVLIREDDYFFGVMHSHVHETWSLATASRHGDGNEGGRPIYNNTTCFETYPFPWPPGHEPEGDQRVEAIAQAARALMEMRNRWLHSDDPAADLKKLTLTNLYNARPTWLDMAHRKLDQSVLDAYGWPHDISDTEILDRLLALNLERAQLQG